MKLQFFLLRKFYCTQYIVKVITGFPLAVMVNHKFVVYGFKADVVNLEYLLEDIHTIS